MLAVLGGHTDCVLFLLEKGALPDAKDKRGSTALHRGVGQTLGINFTVDTTDFVTIAMVYQNVSSSFSLQNVEV